MNSLSERIAKDVANTCEELDYELVSDETDWQDWRHEDEGTVKTVGIDLETGVVTVEILVDGEQEFQAEYDPEDGNTVQQIRRRLY